VNLVIDSEDTMKRSLAMAMIERCPQARLPTKLNLMNQKLSRTCLKR
jgi:hypothetical protein